MKTLTIKTILASVVLPAMLTACYKEDPLHSERGEIPYKIEDSDNPALHYIYEYNQKTGVYILSDYTDVDFKWNVGSESNNDLIRIKDGVLDDAIEYVKAVLTEVYPEEFAKKYFPLKVLLADSISVSTSKSDDLLVGSGRSYIAIGRLHKGDIPTDEDKLADIRGEVSGYLWGNYIYSNNLMTIPEGFFSPSEKYYGVSFKQEEYKQYENDPDYPRKVGFWRYDPDGVYPCFCPKKELDISDFVKTIVTHSSAQMQELMEGYEILRIKYDILIKAVKDNCGVDLQAIGNKYAK